MKDFNIDDAVSEDGKWETVSSEYLFRRPWLTVRHDESGSSVTDWARPVMR